MRKSVLRREITKGVVWVTILLFVGACAKSEHMSEYYQVEAARTQAIIDSINIQAADRGARQVNMMQSYSTSMTAAATTETPSDDVAVALAWGFYMGRPDGIEIPKLPPLKAPPTNVDYIRAWTPLVGMAMPFLYPLAYGWAASSSGSGTRVTADNGGTVLLDSANTGAYNRVGGDYAQSINNDNNSNMGALNESGIRPEAEGEGDDVGGDTTCDPNDPPGGYTNQGTPLMCEGCSCTSFAAGECVCPTLY